MKKWTYRYLVAAYISMFLLENTEFYCTDIKRLLINFSFASMILILSGLLIYHNLGDKNVVYFQSGLCETYNPGKSLANIMVPNDKYPKK